MQVGWNSRATGRTAQRRTKKSENICFATVPSDRPNNQTRGLYTTKQRVRSSKKKQWFKSKLLERDIGANASFFGISTLDAVTFVS